MYAEHMFTARAKKLALVATIFFTIASAVLAWFSPHPDTGSFYLLIAFHVLLLINTYFSVRCFSSIPESESVSQKVVDLLIVITYLLLATQFSNPIAYLTLAMIMFLIATFKYVLMLDAKSYRALLKRKIRIDVLCAVACGLALIGVWSGQSMMALWVWCGVFVMGNVYVLWMNKLYELKTDR